MNKSFWKDVPTTCDAVRAMLCVMYSRLLLTCVSVDWIEMFGCLFLSVALQYSRALCVARSHIRTTCSVHNKYTRWQIHIWERECRKSRQDNFRVWKSVRLFKIYTWNSGDNSISIVLFSKRQYITLVLRSL